MAASKSPSTHHWQRLGVARLPFIALAVLAALFGHDLLMVADAHADHAMTGQRGRSLTAMRAVIPIPANDTLSGSATPHDQQPLACFAVHRGAWPAQAAAGAMPLAAVLPAAIDPPVPLAGITQPPLPPGQPPGVRRALLRVYRI